MTPIEIEVLNELVRNATVLRQVIRWGLCDYPMRGRWYRATTLGLVLNSAKPAGVR